jgi:hypothetical protein
MASISADLFASLSMLDLAPAAVQEFVTRQGLFSELQDVVALVRQVFHVAGPISLSLEEDPDTGESWVEVKVAARGSVDNVMQAHERYTESLLSLPSTSSRQIRLFLHIARD